MFSPAAAPPFGTPPLGSQGCPRSSMASVDLVPRLTMPQGMDPTVQAYGPDGFATMAAPLERSQDLTSSVVSPKPGGSALGPLPPKAPGPVGPPVAMLPPTGAPGPALPPPPGTPPGSGPCFRTMMPTSMSGAGNAMDLGKSLFVVITRLLDMPQEKNLFGMTRSLRARVFDDDNRELECTREIEPNAHLEADSISLSPEEGTLKLHTRSPLMFIQLEHVGGIMGNRVIGRCQIHRMDPRSSQIWPYALSDLDGNAANCGVELKVVESQPLPLGGSVPAMPGSMPQSASPFHMAPPSLPPGSVRPSSLLADGDRPQAAGMQDMSHGVSALLEFDKATDLPYPSDGNADQLMIVVMDEERNKELRRIGPFAAIDQKGPLRRLIMADCKGAQSYVQAMLHFGGSAEEGAMFVKVGLLYLRGSTESELIGITDPIKVSWRPAEKKYYEVRQNHTRKVLGGVYLTHRLMTEAEGIPDLGMRAAKGRRQPPKVGAPLEVHLRVSGRTGNFPAGSQEEAYEQAAINCEAQNRALRQRCKISDPKSQEREAHVRMVNGYREWDSLDSLFVSMGPNPLAMSEELGPSVARSYIETTNMLKEIVPKLGPTASVADEQQNLRLLSIMGAEDPFQVTTTLRPVVCKDPNEIASTRDMRWSPDPPVYAPLRNMSEQDKETMRLACFDPRQNAKIMFADANPNYKIDEDIWGILSDYKTARSLIVPKPETAYRRVKDDCIMA